MQKQIDKAEKEAKEEVYKKQKRTKKQSVDSPAWEPRKHYIAEWVEDPKNPQREAFFDGTHYWFTQVLPSGDVKFQSLTTEEWEERKNAKPPDFEVARKKEGRVKKSVRSKSGRGNCIRQTTKKPRRSKSTRKETCLVKPPKQKRVIKSTNKKAPGRKS